MLNNELFYFLILKIIILILGLLIIPEVIFYQVFSFIPIFVQVLVKLH